MLGPSLRCPVFQPVPPVISEPDGVEVWFDQNQLVGGDAWDQKIRPAPPRWILYRLR